jgi:hypothetical protein
MANLNSTIRLLLGSNDKLTGVIASSRISVIFIPEADGQSILYIQRVDLEMAERLLTVAILINELWIESISSKGWRR